jgi:peptidoglycan/LPS O-acetylase OafA/YrhL
MNGALLLPREHGAYGQVAFPLATALIVAHAQPSSVLMATSVFAMFLAHEPLLVLLGHRGRREQTDRGTSAGWWLVGSLIAATATGILAIDRTPAALRWTYLIPTLPALWVFAAIVRRREKTISSETSVAIAFSAVALPVCAGAGNTVAGATIAAAFAVLFVLGTLFVRLVVFRPGGNRDASRRLRLVRRVGWSLVAASALTAVLLIVAN